MGLGFYAFCAGVDAIEKLQLDNIKYAVATGLNLGELQFVTKFSHELIYIF